MRPSGVYVSAILLLLITGSTAQAAVLQSDDFEAGNEGWGWSVGGSVPWSTVADGGPNGAGDAFLEFNSGSLGGNVNLAAVNALVEEPEPDTFVSNWTGDYSAVGATSVTVDFMAMPQSDPVDLRLVLFGPNDNGQRWITDDVAQVPNDGVWRNYEFSLAEADMLRVLGAGDYATMFGNVLQFMVRHNPLPNSNGVPVNALVGMDNITLLGGGVTGPTADFNNNGSVEVGDLIVWESSFGNDDGADADDDGISDGADLLAWQRQFGEGVAAVGAVPEPATVTLLLCGLAAMTFAARRSRL